MHTNVACVTVCMGKINISLGKEREGDSIGEGSTVGFSCICNVTFLKLGGEYIEVDGIILYT